MRDSLIVFALAVNFYRPPNEEDRPRLAARDGLFKTRYNLIGGAAGWEDCRTASR